MPQSAHEFSAQVQLEASLRYLLYLPGGPPPTDGYPLIVFLHGSGERGDDSSLVLEQGLPRLLNEGLNLAALVLSPRLPAGQLWTRQLRAVRELMSKIMADHDVDTSRVAITGLSLGGAGAYEMASYYPELFSAVAPICGPWTWMFVTDEVARVPTWVFHGDADQVVPVEESRRLVEALEQRGAAPQFTVFPGVGHNSWDPAYVDSDLLAWLLRQRRRGFDPRGAGETDR